MEHSDFSRAQGVVSKHVNVMSALSEQVASRRLMDVSSVSPHVAPAGGPWSANQRTWERLALGFL